MSEISKVKIRSGRQIKNALSSDNLVPDTMLPVHFRVRLDSLIERWESRGTSQWDRSGMLGPSRVLVGKGGEAIHYIQQLGHVGTEA